MPNFNKIAPAQPSRRSHALRLIVKSTMITFCVGLVVLAAFAGYVRWRGAEPGHELAIKWEGAVNDRNFRDLGKSFNDCYGESRLAENLVFRAAMWFSGWSCASVGSPDAIYSLNFDPNSREEFYCHDDDGTNQIGRHFVTHRQLNDLEFSATWRDPDVVQDACPYFADSFAAIARGERVLIHCDAGRDRTGTYAALLTALVLEKAGKLDQRALVAIECDYRKSHSLVAEKYGRMQRFIETLTAAGGVASFFSKTCGIPADVLDKTASRLSTR